jgi:hypothetical protein
LRGKINELETNNKNKNIRYLYRGINDFKKWYEPRINIMKDENGNLLANPQNVLNRWKNFFTQVLNVHGFHDVRFHHNRSTRDQIFYIQQILEKKWEYNGMVHQLFIDLKKAYESIKREVLYNILLEFGIPEKVVRLIKMCLNETYSKVRVGKLLSDKFPIQNGLKQGDALLPF